MIKEEQEIIEELKITRDSFSNWLRESESDEYYQSSQDEEIE